LDGTLVGIRIVRVQGQRRKRRAAEAATIGRFPDQNDVPAGRLCRGTRMDDLSFAHESQGDDVDQDVLVECRIEVDVPGDVRDADRVAVCGDPVDDTLSDVPRVRNAQVAETQRIADRDDRRAHAQDVPHDPADPRRRALEGDDLRGMVVRLVRDDDTVTFAFPLAQMQNARIFLRALHHGRTVGRQAAQVRAAALVRAMLAPLCVEGVHLDERRIASQAVGDAAQLFDGER
jgi:hypothetical protein